MHAMMEPEQILEHARAAEAAGAHRFCMVTQGQGLSKRDFEQVPARACASSPSTPTSSAAPPSGTSRPTAPARCARQASSACTTTSRRRYSYYDEVTSTVRYEGRLRTIDAVREAGLETCVGGILNLGETREQRVEMAFELADINPTSVPINMLNPRPGTKFGDREFMDPWEAVKWIAIFRLILPDALFRLCGGSRREPRRAAGAGRPGRHQRRHDGQLPDDPRQRPRRGPRDVQELGLNVARQPDNAANPRPDNRSGWMSRRDPGRGRGAAGPGARAAARHALRCASGTPPRSCASGPSGRRPAAPRRCAEPRPGGPPGSSMNDVEERLEELERLGLSRRLRLISGPQGPTVLLEGQPGAAAVLEQLPRPRRPPARAPRRRPTPPCAGASAPVPHGWCRAR